MLDGVMLLWFGLSAAAPLFVAVDISRSCSRRINFFHRAPRMAGRMVRLLLERPVYFEPRRSVSGKSLRCGRREVSV